MGQSVSTVNAAGLTNDAHSKRRFENPSDHEHQLPPPEQDQQPLPPTPEEPDTIQSGPTQPSSMQGPSDAASLQHGEGAERDKDKMSDSNVSKSPTKGKTKGQAEVGNNHGQEVALRIPIGCGALKKVFSALKEVAFAEQHEVRRQEVKDEHGQQRSDKSLREAYLEHRFRPKKAVFLKGEKRGSTDILPTISETKRGALWPSRARPHRTQPVLPLPEQQPTKPLTSTPLKSAVIAVGKLPLVEPAVDINRNSALETKMKKSISSDKKNFIQDMELARQLSLKDIWPPGREEQISDSKNTIDKPKRDLNASVDEQLTEDKGEAHKQSLFDNWSPRCMELNDDPEAALSPMQSDEEQDAPFPETLYRYLTEPFQDVPRPLDLSKTPPSTPPIGSGDEQTPGKQISSHSDHKDVKQHSLSPQPGPSKSTTLKFHEQHFGANSQDGKDDDFTSDEEQQFLRDLELARQLSLQENWAPGMGDNDSSDED